MRGTAGRLLSSTASTAVTSSSTVSQPTGAPTATPLIQRSTPTPSSTSRGVTARRSLARTVSAATSRSRRTSALARSRLSAGWLTTDASSSDTVRRRCRLASASTAWSTGPVAGTPVTDTVPARLVRSAPDSTSRASAASATRLGPPAR